MHSNYTKTPSSTESDQRAPDWLKHFLDWLRSEERRAIRARRATIRVAKKQAKSEATRRRYVERALDLSDDVLILVLRTLRILVLLNLCAVAIGMIAFSIFLPLAARTYGVGQVALTILSIGSFLSGAGALTWSLLHRGRTRRNERNGD